MEEILASIRRIIADDQEGGKNPEPTRAAPAPLPEEAEEDDVLDLAEVAPPARPTAPPSLDLDMPDVSFRENDSNQVDFDPIDAEEEPAYQAPPPPKPEPPPSAPRRPSPLPQGGEDQLISAATDASVGQAFSLLAHTVLSNNTRTLEDLVREMLRPMLKHWLDDNLPTIVERLVRAEIERVARGR